MNDKYIKVEGSVKITDPKLLKWLNEAAEHNTKQLEQFLKQDGQKYGRSV